MTNSVYSNMFDKDIASGLIYSDISDHLPIFVICKMIFQWKGQLNQTCTEKKHPKIKSDLAAEEWMDVFNESNANIAYEHFNKKL